MTKLIYLQGYPESLLAQVTTLIEQGRLGEVLQKRYPQGHDVNSDKALYQYTQDQLEFDTRLWLTHLSLNRSA